VVPFSRFPTFVKVCHFHSLVFTTWKILVFGCSFFWVSSVSRYDIYVSKLSLLSVPVILSCYFVFGFYGMIFISNKVVLGGCLHSFFFFVPQFLEVCHFLFVCVFEFLVGFSISVVLRPF